MLAVFYFEYWLQDLVSPYSRNFEEINLKPWLHLFLLATAYFTCVQVDFVNDFITWGPRVEVDGVVRNPVLCCLFWLGWSLGGL